MGEWLNNGPGGNRTYLAVPPSGTGPGVLVLHAWWGLTPSFADACDRLAANGFVALAPSLYPDGATTASIGEAEALAGALFDALEETDAVVLAAAEGLQQLPATTGDQMGVIGFSSGGFWALRLSQARPDAVSAVVTVYSTGEADFSQARAAYLGHFAEQDDFEPPEAVQALEGAIRSAGREVTFHVYPGTGHWFAEPDRPDAYDADAAALVWERTLAFLKARLA